MSNNVVVLKSKAFAIRVVKLCRILKEERHESVLSRQLLRSGTSIGANIHEAQCASSKKDFIAKMYIAFKEAHESEYWIELLEATDYLTSREAKSILSDCQEINRIITSILKTSRAN